MNVETIDETSTERLPSVVQDTGSFRIVREDIGRAGDTSYPITVEIAWNVIDGKEMADTNKPSSDIEHSDFVLSGPFRLDSFGNYTSLIVEIPAGQLMSEPIVLTPAFDWFTEGTFHAFTPDESNPIPSSSLEGKYASWKIEQAYLKTDFKVKYDISEENDTTEIHIKDGAGINMSSEWDGEQQGGRPVLRPGDVISVSYSVWIDCLTPKNLTEDVYVDVSWYNSQNNNGLLEHFKNCHTVKLFDRLQWRS